MLIPKYWAEYTIEFTRINSKNKNQPPQAKKSKIKRYGWSNISVENAKEHAIERCEQARIKWQQGKRINQFEGIANYDELPIREQIIANYQELDCITTINSYGATCLNSQDVMILDIDNWRLGYEFRDPMHQDKSLALFQPTPYMPAQEPYKTVNTGWVNFVATIVFVACVFVAVFLGRIQEGGLLIFAGMCYWLLTWTICHFIARRIEQKNKRQWLAKHGGYLGMLESSMQKFLQDNPESSFKVYKTPMGFRLIYLTDLLAFSNEDDNKDEDNNHKITNESDKKILQIFEALPVDHRYANLCQLQKCYRARVTGKPWRMGINDKPPKQFWYEFSAEVGRELTADEDAMLAYRKKWLKNYQKVATDYRACEFIKIIGNDNQSTHNNIDKKIAKVIALHDELCQCDKKLVLA